MIDITRLLVMLTYQFVVKPRRWGALRGAVIRLSVCTCFANFLRSLVDLPSRRPGRRCSPGNEL